MHVGAYIRRLALTLMILGVASSCVPPPPQRLQDLGTVMDAMAQREAEFGSMSVSAPILSTPNAAFEFNPGPTASDFYNDAKNSIQGRAAEFQQQLTSSGLGVNVSVNPVAAAGYLAQLQQYQAAVNQNNAAQAVASQQQAISNAAAQQALSTELKSATQPSDYSKAISDFQTATQGQRNTPTTLPAFPTLPAPTTAPSLVSPPNTSQFAMAGPNGQLFSGFQQLASNSGALSIPDRTALVTAAGDNAVSAMFQVMGNPQLAQAFHNKRILFGVCTVSVNPGWRTHKDYAANVAMLCRYRSVVARATIVQRYLKDPTIPAALRLRLSLDLNMPLPVDYAAVKTVQNIGNEAKCTALEKWQPNADTPTPPLDGHTLQILSENTGNPTIPLTYQREARVNVCPLVAAVSPLTDVQTLDLSSSYRQEEELAINLAFQLQLTGASAQAQAFLNYAKALQQDFSTLTPNVVANSYSTGATFGFQVGPQLRAIEEARQGKSSGPGEILERQSFPALVIFGFEADDTLPFVTVGSDGKYQLMEPEVTAQSADNWVPVDGGRSDYHPLWSETERLQLAYWYKKYLGRVTNTGLDDSVSSYVNIRGTELCSLVFGNEFDFTLPEELVFPPSDPTIAAVEPSQIRLPECGSKRVPMVLEGANLNTVDLEHAKLVSGGTLIDKKLIGSDAIEVTVAIEATEDPKPLIFALPTYYGAGIYTSPITPLTGSRPDVTQIAPEVIALDGDTSGNLHPADVDVVIVGHHLDLIKLGGIHPTTQPTPPAITVTDVRALGTTAIALHLHVIAPVASLAFELPRKDDGSTSIFTPPIAITGKTMKITVDTGSYLLENGVKPVSPTGVKVQAGDGQATLTWQKTPGATSYQVQYGTTSQGPYLMAKSNISGTTCTVANLTNGKDYYFVVVAIGRGGQSGPSKEVSVKPGKAPLVPQTPTTQPVPTTQGSGMQPSKPNKEDDENDKQSSVQALPAESTETIFHGQTTVEYSPGVSDTVIGATINATTRPSSTADKSSSEGSSPGSAVDLELSLKSGPSTQPAQAGSGGKASSK
jgi:Fibronectin type III domain